MPSSETSIDKIVVVFQATWYYYLFQATCYYLGARGPCINFLLCCRRLVTCFLPWCGPAGHRVCGYSYQTQNWINCWTSTWCNYGMDLIDFSSGAGIVRATRCIARPSIASYLAKTLKSMILSFAYEWAHACYRSPACWTCMRACIITHHYQSEPFFLSSFEQRCWRVLNQLVAYLARRTIQSTDTNESNVFIL